MKLKVIDDLCDCFSTLGNNVVSGIETLKKADPKLIHEVFQEDKKF